MGELWKRAELELERAVGRPTPQGASLNPGPWEREYRQVLTFPRDLPFNKAFRCLSCAVILYLTGSKPKNQHHEILRCLHCLPLRPLLPGSGCQRSALCVLFSSFTSLRITLTTNWQHTFSGGGPDVRPCKFTAMKYLIAAHLFVEHWSTWRFGPNRFGDWVHERVYRTECTEVHMTN